MLARVTAFKFRADARDAAIETMEKLKPQIMALPGLTHFINVVDAEGNGYVMSLVEDEAQNEASTEQVSKLWAQFADYLEAKPEPRTFEVVADWETAGAHA